MAVASRANSTRSTASQPILKVTCSLPRPTAASECKNLSTKASRRSRKRTRVSSGRKRTEGYFIPMSKRNRFWVVLSTLLLVLATTTYLTAQEPDAGGAGGRGGRGGGRGGR